MVKDKDDVFREFQNMTNMTVSEAEAWKDSENFDAYAERKSGGEDIKEPINDAIRLMETPKSEWEDKDDGFNEIEEANQLKSFISRMKANNRGEPMPNTEPPLSKRDASLINWMFDPNPNKSDFVGDRQR